MAGRGWTGGGYCAGGYWTGGGYGAGVYCCAGPAGASRPFDGAGHGAYGSTGEDDAWLAVASWRGDSGAGQYGDGDWAATGTCERGSIIVSADSGATCDGPGAGVGAWMTMPQWPQKRACGGLS